MKSRTYLLKWQTICLALVVFVFTAPAASSQSLYSLSLPRGIDGVAAVEMNSVDASALEIDAVVDVELPSGQFATGTVISELTGVGRPDQSGSQETSRKVVSLQGDAGALELIVADDRISGMIIHDADTREFFRADFDTSGWGVLRQEDANQYQCFDFPRAPEEAVEAIPATADLTPDLTTLQNLESKPGAGKTLYINYWGGTLSGTAWNNNYNSGNPINYTPYDTDGNTSDFSSYERYVMWMGWRETAEDYAPFDINVTTKQSVYDATAVSKRSQIISTTTNYFYTGAGGVAYVGIFNNSSDYYKTGWAWNKSLSSLGMTIAHEAGHQMGLGHDGTSSTGYYGGHGVWGPIMGAPFGKPYVQWSIGEYPNANNSQNDFAIISSSLGTTTDDAGDTLGTATALTAPVTDLEAHITPDGLSSDVDVYSFDVPTSGAVHVDVTPLLGDEGESRAANLAINVTLRSASSVIASMGSADNSPLNPSTNSFVYDGTLPAGTYYIEVDAVSPDADWSSGFGEYGNGGVYRLSLTAPTGGTPPAVTSPTPGSNLSGTTETFAWTDNGTSVVKYWFYIGSSAGANDYFDSGDLGTATSVNASGLPTDGSTLHVRFYYMTGSSWEYVDYTYTAASLGGGSPSVDSPENGSTLSGNSETFTWSANGAAVAQYWLYLGSNQGGYDIYNGDQGTATSVNISSLPTDGRTIYLRLYYLIGTTWNSVDYSYTAASSGGGGTPGLTSPTPGSTLSGSSETFSWDANGANVDKYWMYVGNSPGAYDIYASGDLGMATSTSVDGLPTDGRTIHVRFYYLIDSAWSYVDYTYTAATVAGGEPAITSPTPGSALSGTSETFSWTDNGTGVAQYWLFIGSSEGAYDIYTGDQGTSTSANISGLPTDGSTVYVRFWYKIGSFWHFLDYTYTATTQGSADPAITTPAPDSTLSGSSVTFGWSGGSISPSKYWLYAGSSVGARDYHDSNDLSTATSTAVSGLPTDGSTVYVRLWYYTGVWDYQDYTYTAQSAGGNGSFDAQFDGDANGWFNLSGSAPWSVQSSQWYYTAGAANQFASTYYGSHNDSATMYGDFDYQARLFRAGCDDCANGIIFRGNPDPAGDGYRWDHGYAFLYSRNGNFAVFSYDNGVASTIQNWTYSSAINTGGSWNTLRVVTSGTTIYFYINGTHVGTLTNAGNTSGKAGLIMYSNGTAGDALWVDWATLQETAGSFVPPAGDTSSAGVFNDSVQGYGDDTGIGEYPQSVSSSGSETSAH